MPFVLWHALGWISEHVPGAPLTRNQIELMELNTVASPELPGLPELAIEPTAIEPVVLKIERSSVRA
jgi:NADH dehydrogenase